MRPQEPLSGIVIVELGHSVAAPFGAQILADLGATVVKVERPGIGDDARRWAPRWLDSSATYQSLNRNKQSVTVDFKNEAEVARLRAFIVGTADAVLQNMRPGLAARFGLDASLIQQSKRLIYCNIGAFGAAGPLAERPGYDPMMQAFGGIMSITGEAGRPPVRVGPSIVDISAGMWAVIGILAALQRRAATGRGCEVDTSLFETALAWMSVPIAIYMASGEVQNRLGTEAVMLAPYKAYKASDSYLIIAAGNDNLFRRLSDALGHAEWADDPRFASNPARVQHRKALNRLIDDIVGQKPRDHWIEVLEAAGVPCAPMQTVDEVITHPQTAALGAIQQSPDGVVSTVGLPLSFDGQRPPFRQRAPTLGQDNTAVFGERTRAAVGEDD